MLSTSLLPAKTPRPPSIPVSSEVARDDHRLFVDALRICQIPGLRAR